jgi:hypothetical protein
MKLTLSFIDFFQENLLFYRKLSRRKNHNLQISFKAPLDVTDIEWRSR